MKIIFVNILMGMFRGGGENYDLNMSKQLSERGHQIEFYFLRPVFHKQKFLSPDYVQATAVRCPWLYLWTQRMHAIPILRHLRGLRGLPRAFSQTLFELRVFFALYRRRKEEFIVHSCGLSLLGALVYKVIKRKSFVRFPGPPAFTFEYWCIRRCYGIIANGNAYQCISQKDIKPAVLHYLNVGVDQDCFKPGKDILQLRQQLGLPVQAKIALFVGRLVSIKNPLLLIEAMHRVVQEQPEAYLVLVGDGPLRPSLRQRSIELEVQEHIIFISHQKSSKLALYYQAADIFVLSSSYDNFPNAVIEAMASGLPVVASNVGGIPEQVKQGHTGFLVDEQSPRLFADAVLRLMTNDTLRERLAMIATQDVRASYSWHKTADKFIAMLA